MAALLHRIFSRLIFCTLSLSILTSSIANGPGGSGPGGSGGTNPPPANDNFSNRILSEETSITITGSLSGATIENEEKYTTVSGTPSWYLGAASVWFSWKAPESGIALLLPKTRNRAYISVSSGTNLIAAQDTNYLVAEVTFPSYFTPNRYVTFQAEAGTEYQIRILGSDAPDPFEISLALTNLPVILEHPRSRTASPGACTLFTISTVAHEGQLPTIRWQLNGTNMSGRTSPILALTNISPENAGDYRAVVTSPTRALNGQFLSRTSSVAQLVVKEPASPTLFVRREGKRTYLDVEGEIGRSYVLHSVRSLGTGFQSFLSSRAFPVWLEDQPPGSENGSFVYVEVREPSSPGCDLNLTRIHFAKVRFSEDRNLGVGDQYADSELDLYLQSSLQCPEGGTYTLMPLFMNPVCSKGSAPDLHILEVQNTWP